MKPIPSFLTKFGEHVCEKTSNNQMIVNWDSFIQIKMVRQFKTFINLRIQNVAVKKEFP